MKKLIFLLLPVCALLSCHKKNSPVPLVPATVADYFLPLKTGSYWAYQRAEQYGTYPNFTTSTIADTIRIVNDTIINGITYYNITGGIWEYVDDGLYADSAGYIIAYSTGLYPMNLQPNDTIRQSNQGPYAGVIRSPAADTLINVPLGAFSCWQTIFDTYYLTSQPPQPFTNPRIRRVFFAKNVGVVAASDFFVDQSAGEYAQLVGYHIGQ